MTTAAMPVQTWTITTAKGSCSGTLSEVAAWQAEHQGSFAEVTCAWTFGDADFSVNINADDIDFDADDLSGAITSLRNARDWEIDRLCSADDRAEAGI